MSNKSTYFVVLGNIRGMFNTLAQAERLARVLGDAATVYQTERLTSHSGKIVNRDQYVAARLSAVNAWNAVQSA